MFSAAADFSIDAGNRVTFTSDWNGVDYASEDNGYARLYWNTNVHCFNDMVFDKVIFEHPKAGRYIGLNGHDLTVTDVRYFSAAAGNKLITSIRSTALYGILSGDFLTVNYLGADLSGLNQTITVDSGMWLCVDVGCYRSLKESAFSDGQSVRHGAGHQPGNRRADKVQRDFGSQPDRIDGRIAGRVQHFGRQLCAEQRAERGRQRFAGAGCGAQYPCDL